MSSRMSSPGSRLLGRLSLRSPETWAIILAGCGIAVSVYLTAVHFQDSLLVCTGVSDCETVQNSKYAKLLGIPVAILGLAMYIAALILAVARLARDDLADRATVLLFVMLFAGLLFTAYLTYLELFVIDAICQWCVVSAVITTAMLVLEGSLVRRVLEIEPTEE
jgi:uncharacterized membrane protein